MRQTTFLITVILSVISVLGCSSADDRDGNGGDGENGEGNDRVNSQYGTRPSSEFDETALPDFNECTSSLIAIVRDFPDSHPDFHHSGEVGKAGEDLVLGMVQETLGPDEKPVAGANAFHSSQLDEWYTTRRGINEEFIATILLGDIGNGVWSHNNDAFFPLGPSQGYGHENNTDIDGVKRNFLFTTELRLRFTYKEGQRFRFKGDDDLWVYINGKLAIDLGGIHSEREAEVDIDAHAAKYDMVPGGVYTMHIFHAERNPVESHFRIDTNIECFTSDGPVV
jgi:fibro-slime domain-containing protein